MARDVCPKCSSFTALGASWCFKCGYLTGYNISGYTHLFFAAAATEGLVLPPNLVLNPNNFHHAALHWLYKAHLSNQTIIKQYIGYCADSHKVFVPALNSDNTVMFYQMRRLNPWDPKYKTYGNASAYLVHYCGFPESNQVVIVEDHLSAIRLRKHSNVVALSGTTLSNSHCKDLCKQYTDFVFWLDSDQAGLTALRKNTRILRRHSNRTTVNSLFMYGTCRFLSCSYVDYEAVTPDPKLLTDYTINKTLLENLLLCE